jgi:hypothetical protein
MTSRYETVEDQEAEEEIRELLETKLSSYGVDVKIYPAIEFFPADWIIELPNQQKVLAEFKRATYPAAKYNREGLTMTLRKYQEIRMICHATGIPFAAFFLTTDYLFSFITCHFEIPNTGVIKYKNTSRYNILVNFPFSLLTRW